MAPPPRGVDWELELEFGGGGGRRKGKKLREEVGVMTVMERKKRKRWTLLWRYVRPLELLLYMLEAAT